MFFKYYRRKNTNILSGHKKEVEANKNFSCVFFLRCLHFAACTIVWACVPLRRTLRQTSEENANQFQFELNNSSDYKVSFVRVLTLFLFRLNWFKNGNYNTIKFYLNSSTIFIFILLFSLHFLFTVQRKVNFSFNSFFFVSIV